MNVEFVREKPVRRPGGRVMYALVDMPAEVHALPGHVQDDRFTTDSAHEMTKDCRCRPQVNWLSAAAPRPLYEHR